MTETTEMRWWWPGSPSPDVTSWFAGLDGALEDEGRTDHYLVLASDRDTGIKIRAGAHIEVKALSTREVATTVADGVVGTLEQWVKWSFPLAADPTADDGLAERPRTWVRTGKRRWLVDVGGCEVELVQVDVRGTRWWSLAAEADGSGEVGRERLVEALAWLSATDPPGDLDLVAGRSHGYAELLDRLIATA